MIENHFRDRQPGAPVNQRRARAQMPANRELTGPIQVDTRCVRVPHPAGRGDSQVRKRRPQVLPGMGGHEYCLRLRALSYALYMYGALWNELRETISTPGFQHIRLRWRNLIRVATTGSGI